MSHIFLSFNFAKIAKIREIAKFNLAKIKPIKVDSSLPKYGQDSKMNLHYTHRKPGLFQEREGMENSVSKTTEIGLVLYLFLCP